MCFEYLGKFPEDLGGIVEEGLPPSADQVQFYTAWSNERTKRVKEEIERQQEKARLLGSH
jgi:hypothetical protein